MKKIMLIIVFCCSILLGNNGGISGRVLDAETKAGIPLANIVIPGTLTGTTTDFDGNFTLEGLPPGSYLLRVSYIGYQPKTLTDVIVRPGRNTPVHIEIQPVSLEMDSLVVYSGFFGNTADVFAGVTEFSAEEIRRAPGSAGDVSRILYGLPSVAKVNDGKSSFLVRGGSALENVFYVDNIEIPYINHFSSHGSSEGLFGILNVDFVRNITFSPGGFSVKYGDRLSSVMDIQLREGNKEHFEGQADLGYATAGVQLEGPLPGGKGSYLMGFKKSYLDLVMKTFAEGYPSPEFWDYQGKVVYKASDKHTISLLGIYADDRYRISHNKAVEKELNERGKADVRTATAGINWKYLQDTAGYVNTALSFNTTSRGTDLYKTESGLRRFYDATGEYSLQIRMNAYRRLSSELKTEWGLELKQMNENIWMNFSDQRDSAGNIYTNPGVRKSIDVSTIGSFMNAIYAPGNGIELNLGLRGVYSDINNKIQVFMRGGARYSLSPVFTLGVNAGRYGQHLPLFLLAQNEDFKKLTEPSVEQYSVTGEYLLTENTRFTVDIYRKKYKNLPASGQYPSELVFDEPLTEGLFRFHSALAATGTAESRGIEIILQKKLMSNIYGMASASYSENKYRGADGIKRARATDNVFNFSMEGGYKPDNEWEYSLRWIYAGGAPYTPFDEQLSKSMNDGIRDITRIHSERLPDYHALNIRVDRRFHFSGSNMVVYFSIWNVYNRKNISSYSWNEFKNEKRAETGWDLLPLFGLKYEF